MLNGYIITSAIIAVSFIVLAAIVLSRNSRSVLNRLFLLFSGCLAIWLVSNYLAGDVSVPQSIALPANRLVFAFGCASTLTILLFIKNLTDRKINKFEKLLLAMNGVSIIGSFTPLIVQNIFPEGDTYLITFAWLSNLYFLTILLNVIFIVFNVFKARKNSSGVLRSQLYVIQLSFAAGLIAIIITNALLPFVFGYFGATNIGSFFSAFFVIGIAYAILRHKLFDLRLVVARTMAYALTLGTAVAIFASSIVVLFRQFNISDASTVTQQLYYLLLALFFGFTFTPLKRFFDKVTSAIFYRDAYEPQNLLNDLNSSLVSTVDVKTIMKNSSLLIEHYLKPTYVLFCVYEAGKLPEQYYLTDEQKKKLPEIIKLAHQLPDKLTVVSDQEAKGVSHELRQVAQDADVELVVHLLSPNEEDKKIGSIVMGLKKSGSIYSESDYRVMEIIADELVIAIQNALRFEEIQQFNVTLQGKVDKATAELRKANEKLIAMDQTKDDFISMASHQLRTPLTSVKGYVSMVLEGDVGKITKEQRKLLDQSFLSAQRMVYLIADLLNVSRLKTGKFVIEPKPTNLAEVVEGELEQLKETAAARNLEMTYEKPKSFPVLNLDETKIRQVIMNFADNAIYYTPAGGHIKVELVDKGESVEFTVTDDGIGVPKSEQHNLFNKFYRAGNAKKARPDGTGLGLFMAKKVVIAQGGAIIFKTEEGKGSTFGFSFEKKKLTPETHSVQFDADEDESGGEEPAAPKTAQKGSKQPENAQKA